MDGARYLEDGRLTIFKRSGLYYARLRTSHSAKYSQTLDLYRLRAWNFWLEL